MSTRVTGGTRDRQLFGPVPVGLAGASEVASRIEKLVDPGALPSAPERVAIAALPETTDSDDDSENDALDEDSAGEAPASGERPSTTGVPSAPPPSADMLTGVRVERTETGGLRIEAPPEAAQWMATAFEAMAMLMRGATTTTKTP